MINVKGVKKLTWDLYTNKPFVAAVISNINTLGVEINASLNVLSSDSNIISCTFKLRKNVNKHNKTSAKTFVWKTNPLFGPFSVGLEK